MIEDPAMTDRTHPRRELLAFDRADRWGVLMLLVVVSAATLLSQVLSRVVAWVRGEDLLVPTFGPVEVPALDAAGVRHSEGSYDVHLADPTSAQRALDLVPGVLVTALAVAACLLLVALVRDLAAGDPFRERAAMRLWLLAIVLAVGLPVSWFARATVDVVLLTGMDLGAGGPGIVLSLPWVPVLAGTVIALIATAFRSGEQLREDVEGLV
jgi:hypothetical protein